MLHTQRLSSRLHRLGLGQFWFGYTNRKPDSNVHRGYRLCLHRSLVGAFTCTRP